MAAAVVLDAGPLLMLARHDKAAVEWLAEAIERETALLCAGATYAEVWRGHSQGSAAGQQAIRLSRALASTTPVPTDDTIGRKAGELIASGSVSGREAVTLDAIVVATAAARHASVLTIDPGDLEQLAAPIGVLIQTLPADPNRAPGAAVKRQGKRRGGGRRGGGGR
jgi:hypothetical protein